MNLLNQTLVNLVNYDYQILIKMSVIDGEHDLQVSGSLVIKPPAPFSTSNLDGSIVSAPVTGCTTIFYNTATDRLAYRNTITGSSIDLLSDAMSYIYLSDFQGNGNTRYIGQGVGSSIADRVGVAIPMDGTLTMITGSKTSGSADGEMRVFINSVATTLATTFTGVDISSSTGSVPVSQGDFISVLVFPGGPTNWQYTAATVELTF